MKSSEGELTRYRGSPKLLSMEETLLIGWTTCDNQDVAERLAFDLIDRKYAACVQIESIRSLYSFNGTTQRESELRLTIKFVASKLAVIEAYILANHPYDIPQWTVVQASHVNERYLNWAVDASKG